MLEKRRIKYRIRLLHPSENSWVRFGICYGVPTHRLKDLQQTTSRTWSAESKGNRSHLEAMKTLTPKILGIKKNTGEYFVCGIWNHIQLQLETSFFPNLRTKSPESTEFYNRFGTREPGRHDEPGMGNFSHSLLPSACWIVPQRYEGVSDFGRPIHLCHFASEMIDLRRPCREAKKVCICLN